MIIVTGAAGFIGSAFVWQLNTMGIEDIIVSDKLRTEDKWLNLAKRKYYDWVDKDELFNYLETTDEKITAIIHMGACSATTEKDMDFLMDNNYEYTKKLWDYAIKKDAVFIYASSAATYGDGELGYNDEIDLEGHTALRPLNKYGYSKKIFDVWALKQKKTPKKWFGLKFFNVYGPQEYHKGRMASMVFHTFNQYNAEKGVKLFKSHKEGYKDGYQLRDFVYIKDVTNVMYFLMKEEGAPNGVYNLGTGGARAFYELAKLTVESMNGDANGIKFVDMPEDLRGKYQYFTEAKMEKLKKAGYNAGFTSLEEGIKDYVQNYLMKEDKYL